MRYENDGLRIGFKYSSSQSAPRDRDDRRLVQQQRWVAEQQIWPAPVASAAAETFVCRSWSSLKPSP